MDANFCEPLDNYVAKADGDFADCVQIQNISGSMLRITDGVYLRNYCFAFVSADNKYLEKLEKARKIKVHQFSVSKTNKKKKNIDEPAEIVVNEPVQQEATSIIPEEIQQEEVVTTSIDVSNLESVFTAEESNKNQDEIYPAE